MSETVQTIAHHRIERIVKRGKKAAGAVFEVHQPALHETSWIACRAVVAPWGVEIGVYDTRFGPEHAAALSTALSMAIDWIAQEKQSNAR